MNRERILTALENEEFDGINHTYEPYEGYGKNESYQIKMVVIGSSIEITKIYRNKFFDGKESTWETDESVETLSGDSAVDFVEKRPYYFKQVRPDLF